MSHPDDLAAERLRLALDMFATGEAIMRQNLRRKHPSASSVEIEAMLQSWLLERPGAELGDGEGTIATWPRRG